MNHVRVGGVCLLLLIIAAALPINVLAQTPSENDNAANGAAPIISQSLLSKSTQGETISAEKLAKRNTGLKPLASSGQAAKSETTAAPEEAANTAPSAPESNAKQETAIQEPAQDATITPDMIQTEASAEPSAISNDAAASDQTAEVATETTIAPPEDVALGTTVSPDATATSITDSQNASRPIGKCISDRNGNCVQ